VRNQDGKLVESTLPSRSGQFSVEEKEGFIQIGVPYTVRTKKYVDDQTKMKNLNVDVCLKQTGGN
jgi:hypothetical protein